MWFYSPHQTKLYNRDYIIVSMPEPQPALKLS